MAEPLEDTCDPGLTSWVASANAVDHDFPIQNLPLGVVRPLRSTLPWRISAAIGEDALDLRSAADMGLLDSIAPPVLAAVGHPSLGGLLALGREAIGELRLAVQRLLRADAAPGLQTAVTACLLPRTSLEFTLPAAPGSFTDFFASLHHATNVTRVRNPSATLHDNYAPAPLAYQGRASSLVVSGTPVSRPHGPRRGPSGPVYAPTAKLDYEAELGFLVGPATPPGIPLEVDRAPEHLAGVCLLNDWSARDVQAFETQPLGPFLSKSFATSLAPWMVTMQALEPFRVPAAPRPDGYAPPLPHLVAPGDQARGGVAITIEVALTSQAMREMHLPEAVLSRADARTLFWTPAQLLAHHTSNGCSLQAADLLGTGTISEAAPGSFGSLLEITRGGREPLTLPTGEVRGFLEDGDEVTLRAFCSAPGARRIGFGECRGRVMPATVDRHPAGTANL